ncbi:hypothetical protein O181_055175 [Austropuccinia psidii MF-1]|uniref:Tyrosinase copper-binding domain-containing protein n=1 Tax=Austropuccinia psidii MF-1 TaxID=1389203 RepID=A0A9Q3E3U0_9BASI|nr:hypothetical protein [Austropuccinia psidii MF-1]
MKNSSFLVLTLVLFSFFNLSVFGSINRGRRFSRKRSSNSTNGGTCETILVRREWRTLSYDEQADYIRAVKCLERRPSRLLGPPYRRCDDFQYVHCNSRSKVHLNEIFLSWHAYFLVIYEKVLRDECGYLGALPYWNWSLDADNITQSPLLSSDPLVGFGSNGSVMRPDPNDLGAGIVSDGAFAWMRVMYPTHALLQRNFRLDPAFLRPGYYLGSQYYNAARLNTILSQKTFIWFLMTLEGNYMLSRDQVIVGPHSVLHTLLGGVLIITFFQFSVFYPHHCHVERIYQLWKSQDPERRTYEYSDLHGNPADLDRSLDYMGLVPSIRVRDAMDALKPPMCYRYE